MKGLAPWLLKAALSAVYWTAAMYLLLPLSLGDRVVDGAIVPPAVTVPPWLLWIAAVLIYAAGSYAFDRAMIHRSRRNG